VGQAKSGTASLAGLLSAHYRAAHEPERADTLRMVLRESRGEVTPNGFRAYLIERDERLDLDYDIAWANQFMVGHLVEAFPDARFLVLVREPYSWLRSVAGHLLSREIPPEVRAFLDWWFRPDEYPPTPRDRTLQERGLYSAAAFLAVWNRHVDACTRAIPPARRLILRTHELARSHERLADFLGIPPETLDGSAGHENRSTWSGRLESLVDPEHVQEVVASICRANMDRLFPEVAGIGDARALWETTGS
jgi:hypothetical protein